MRKGFYKQGRVEPYMIQKNGIILYHTATVDVERRRGMPLFEIDEDEQERLYQDLHDKLYRDVKIWRMATGSLPTIGQEFWIDEFSCYFIVRNIRTRVTDTNNIAVHIHFKQIL